MSSRWTYFGILALGAGFASCLAFTISLITVDKIMKITKRKKIIRIIDTIGEFTQPYVFIKNPEKVEELVCQLIKGGSSKLQVISDLEQTLLKIHCEGRMCNSNHTLLINTNGTLLKNGRTSFNSSDHRMCIIEWYLKERNQLQQSCKENKEKLEEVGKEKLEEVLPELFVQGSTTLFDTLKQKNIPLYIGTDSGSISGVRDLLDAAQLLSPNVIIFPLQGKNGKMDSILDKAQNYLSNFESRPNAIVLSHTLPPSSVSDMKSDLNPESTILTIGFLDTLDESDVSKFQKKFDIVIAGVQSIAAVNSLLYKIVF